MDKLQRVLREPVLLSYVTDLALSPLRVLRLHMMAWWSGGRCSFGRGILVKHPTVFQGRGRLIVSDGVIFGFQKAGALKLPILLQPREAAATIRIGERTAVMNGSEVIARQAVTIGADCLIGPHTIIYDSDFHGLDPRQRLQSGETEPVVIGDNVWVGTRVMILKGVSIGRDCVIAAASVVTRDVPDGMIVGGNPARTIASVYEDAGQGLLEKARQPDLPQGM